MRRALLALAAVALVGTVTMIVIARSERPPPNVLVVITDDQRLASYETMSRTIGWLRKEGTEYTNAVAVTPSCCPSRATIMSGQYPHNHGTLKTTAESAGLYKKSNSVQADLRAGGYFTAIAGKYFNGVISDPPYFDHWAISRQLKYHDSEFNVDGNLTTATGYSTTFIQQKTEEFIRSFELADDARPWYAYVGMKTPHIPSTPESKYSTAWFPAWKPNPANAETDLSDKPTYVRNNSVTLNFSKSKRRQMYRALYSVDDGMVSLFDKLAALGELDNTLVIFLADHAFMWWEHQLSAKHVPYNESVRIPFFVRWPGHVAAGARDNSVVAPLDVAPTVYQATGIAPEHVMDGKPVNESARSRIFMEYWPDGTTEGNKVPEWKAVWSPQETYIRYASGEREYYASDDPWQLSNRYKDGVIGNEPTDEAALDRLILQQSRCQGGGCL